MLGFYTLYISLETFNMLHMDEIKTETKMLTTSFYMSVEERTLTICNKYLDVLSFLILSFILHQILWNMQKYLD